MPSDNEIQEALREVMGATVEMTTWMLSEFGDAIVAVPGFERWRTADARARELLMREKT